MKIVLKKITRLTAAVVVPGMLLAVISCASAPAASAAPAEKKVVAKTAPKVYGKIEFMEDLQNALDSEGPESALGLYETKLPVAFADDFDLLFLKACISLSADKLADASSICSALSARDPNNQDVIALAAQIAKMSGNKAEHTKQVNALLAKDKLNPSANIEMGEDAFSKKNYKQALQYYKRALVREPENIDALWGVGQSDYYLERDDESKEYFNKILELDPKNAQAYSYLGKIAYANNEYKIASDYAAKALKLNPNDYNFNLDYGMYERYLGHTDVAEKYWTKAIQIEGGYFLAYAYRAGLYDETGRFPQALKDYQEVIRLNPKYYYAYESVGILAVIEKEWTKAREAFMKCMEFNKENISYPLMVTYCYYMEKNDIEAKKFSDGVLRKMADRNSIEYKMLRLFHDRSGEKPLPQLVSSISSSNKKGKMYFYLGLFAEMSGGIEGAKDFYSKVLDMNSPMFFEYRLAEISVKGKSGLEY